MLFMFNSHVCDGVSREQIVEYAQGPRSDESWELIRQGKIAHRYWKLGDDPGLVVVAHCAHLEEAKEYAASAPIVKAGLVEFRVDPIDIFPSKLKY